MTPEAITAEQRQVRVPMFPTSRGDYRRTARWWELEAMRDLSYEVEPGKWVREGKRTVYKPGVTSSDKSREYARNMRWAAELVLFHGPGTWLQLRERRAAAAGGTA